MKRLKLITLLAMIPLIIACNGEGASSSLGDSSSGGDVASSSGGDSTTSGIDRSGFVWTITFDSQGGSAVASQEVKDGEKAVEPTAPTYEGYVFQGWYKDSYAVTPFDFDTAITADWTLYAGWQRSLDVSTSSGGGSSSSQVPTPSSDPYGPEGSELVSWYIVGSGANFSDWNASGGIQMYSDPSGQNNACILNVTFAVGDQWKIMDGGSTWLGYDACDSSDKATYFEDADGNNHNFGVIAAGSYDIYLNTSNRIYVVTHAA